MPDIKVPVKDFDVEASPALTDYVINERIGGSGKQPKITLWSKIFTMFQTAGVLVETYEDGISAAGTNQATATVLTKNITRVDTVAPGTGVIDNVVALDKGKVINNGANDLNFYPRGTNQFYDMSSQSLLGAGTPVIIVPGNNIEYRRDSNGYLMIYA